MPQKANPPRGQVAREPEISLLELRYYPKSTDGEPATFLRADIQPSPFPWLDKDFVPTGTYRKILEAIAHFFYTNGFAIEQKELRAAIAEKGEKNCKSPDTLRARLTELKDAGYLDWLENEERTLHLTPKGRLVALETPCQQQLSDRLTAYQQKLTQDQQRAINAAERSDARIADLFADLEEFNSDGGVYASEL